MKKTTAIFALLCTMAFSAQAAPVTPSKAQQAARQYIVANNPSYAQSTLTLCYTWNDSHGDATMYVFNIGSDGFIIISANDDMPPIQGVSFNGAYRRDSLPPNLHWWLEAYNEDIEAVLSCSHMPRKMAEEQQQWRAEWTALETKDLSYYQQYASKAVQALVQTKWDQCNGYNNYCPQYSGAGYGYGGRSATGCVATAMAQIIRYYEYPNTGFYLGGDMPMPPLPPVFEADVRWNSGDTTPDVDGQNILFDITGDNSSRIWVDTPMNATALYLMNPRGHDYEIMSKHLWTTEQVDAGKGVLGRLPTSHRADHPQRGNTTGERRHSRPCGTAGSWHALWHRHAEGYHHL